MSLCTFVLAVLLGVLPLAAQEHVVSRSELRQAVSSAAEQRQANLARLEKFFATAPARKALAAVKADPAEIRTAISLLGDEELARLAAKTAQVDSNFAGAGISLTNQQVTYIIIGAIAIAIIAIIAAH